MFIISIVIDGKFSIYMLIVSIFICDQFCVYMFIISIAKSPHFCVSALASLCLHVRHQPCQFPPSHQKCCQSSSWPVSPSAPWPTLSRPGNISSGCNSVQALSQHTESSCRHPVLLPLASGMVMLANLPRHCLDAYEVYQVWWHFLQYSFTFYTFTHTKYD